MVFTENFFLCPCVLSSDERKNRSGFRMRGSTVRCNRSATIVLYVRYTRPILRQPILKLFPLPKETQEEYTKGLNHVVHRPAASRKN